MKVSRLSERPPTSTAKALARFERQFTYPLGETQRFSISHGADYPRFFRAIGEAACFVAEEHGEVAGVLGCALTRLWTPERRTVPAIYFGDIKVTPSARGGRVLFRLLNAARAWVDDKATLGYGVVMDNTGVLPGSYTGRLGLPSFEPVGQITLFHFDTGATSGGDDPLAVRERNVGDSPDSKTLLGEVEGFASISVSPSLRSRMSPVVFDVGGGRATGMLEDTLAAKRLLDEQYNEIVSAHLSYFHYSDLEAAVDLIDAACRQCRELAYPKMFVAVSSVEADELGDALEGRVFQRATATVYGTGFDSHAPWYVNSSEI